MRARRPIDSQRRCRGLTLVELLIALGLSSVLLGAVLNTFLVVAKGGMNLANYASMDGEARGGLDVFGRDLRQADTITWNSATSFTITVRGAPITYSLVYDRPSREWHFRRDDRTIVRGIELESFRLTAYKVAFAPPEGEETDPDPDELRPVAIALDDLARASRETKQLQLEFKSTRHAPSLAGTSNSVVSARFILRNKRVTS